MLIYDTPLWSIVDTAWYLSFYPVVRALAESDDETTLTSVYMRYGRQLGHSPNPLFHEMWYLQQNPDVRQTVQGGGLASGFEHYRAFGCAERPPHWLFRPSHYEREFNTKYQRAFDPELDGNIYDHFLRLGQFQGLSGHWLFDAGVYEALSDYETIQSIRRKGPYATYVSRLGLVYQEGTTTHFFDPHWYLAAYPQVSQGIDDGIWTSALEHYLSNQAPLNFDPTPIFSESAYCMAYEDVRTAIAQNAIRNGYEHYLLCGRHENRPFFGRG